jgi:hypothetical protein
VHVKHYASSRLEAAGRAKLAKGAAAICGAIGAADETRYVLLMMNQRTFHNLFKITNRTPTPPITYSEKHIIRAHLCCHERGKVD